MSVNVSCFAVFYLSILDDLRHLTAVRNNQHSKFADENGMAGFLLSAKNGDQVKHAFWKISATLAGMPFSLLHLRYC